MELCRILSTSIMLTVMTCADSTQQSLVYEKNITERMLIALHRVASDEEYALLKNYCVSHPAAYATRLVKDIASTLLRLVKEKRDNPIRRYYVVYIIATLLFHTIVTRIPIGNGNVFLPSFHSPGSFVITFLAIGAGIIGACLSLDYYWLQGDKLIRHLEELITFLSHQPLSDGQLHHNPDLIIKVFSHSPIGIRLASTILQRDKNR